MLFTSTESSAPLRLTRNILHNIDSGAAKSTAMAFCPLLYRCKETLREGIIIRAARPAHAAADTILPQHIPIAPTAVLTTPVAVKYESGNIRISGQSI